MTSLIYLRKLIGTACPSCEKNRFGNFNLLDFYFHLCGGFVVRALLLRLGLALP